MQSLGSENRQRSPAIPGEDRHCLQWRKLAQLSRSRLVPLVVLGQGAVLMLWLLVLLGYGPKLGAQQAVMLSWDTIDGYPVAGFNVYYGGESGVYTNSSAVGDTNSAIVTGLTPGAKYYFVVTVVDVQGNESAYSNEISFTMPLPSPTLNLNLAPDGTVSLGGSGVIGHTYEIQATTDFVTWAMLGTQTTATDGTIAFLDADSPNYPARFYRLQDTQP